MKALKVIAAALAVILLLLLLTVILLETRNNDTIQQTVPTTQAQNTSGMLSWEEYQAMSLEEQDAYFQQFESVEQFEKWMDSVRPTETDEVIPTWDPTAKKPDTYTWEEYEALSREEQEAFYQWFASGTAFEAWMNKAKPAQTDPTQGQNDNPGQTDKPNQTEKPNQTDKPNQTGKNPSDYTWEEYQKLSPQEKETFFQWFGSVEAFEKWMDKVKPEETEPTTPSWNKPGKKPNEYTWAEYMALSREDQDAFYLWFDSEDDFEEWMEAAKPEETEPTDPVWSKPGKTPDQYTWEEYQALSQKDQDAFYLWFDSEYAFEQWMKAAKPAETTPTTPVWDKTDKKPNEYTWAEYEALTNEEKDAFFLWFGSIEAFENWMDSAQ